MLTWQNQQQQSTLLSNISLDLKYQKIATIGDKATQEYNRSIDTINSIDLILAAVATTLLTKVSINGALIIKLTTLATAVVN